MALIFSITDPMSAARCKAGALARPQGLRALVGLEHDLARHHPDELVLLAVRVPSRRLSAGHDARQVHAEIRQSYMVAEPAVPALAVQGRGTSPDSWWRCFRRYRPDRRRAGEAWTWADGSAFVAGRRASRVHAATTSFERGRCAGT
jgi:hypothetical protein